jgi:hypothetical protein
MNMDVDAWTLLHGPAKRIRQPWMCHQPDMNGTVYRWQYSSMKPTIGFDVIHPSLVHLFLPTERRNPAERAHEL